MYSDPHVEPWKVYDRAHFSDHLDHAEARGDHVHSLLRRMAVVFLVAIHKPHHHVAVPDRVQFEHLLGHTNFIELREEVPQHVHDLLGLDLARVLREASDIGEEESDIFKLIDEHLFTMRRGAELFQNLGFNISVRASAADLPAKCSASGVFPPAAYWC